MIFDESTPRKKTLQEIAKMLRDFDFENYNILKDKPVLLAELNQINSKLGKILGGFND